MVLYDFLMIVKSSVPKNQVADILRRAGTRVLDANGVITDITSFGTRTLAYQFRTPGETHFEVSVDSANERHTFTHHPHRERKNIESRVAA